MRSPFSTLRSRRLVWTLIAFAPILVVALANATFIRNHFYVRGPYLHDAGWFSGIVYRAGLVPRNPPALAGGLTYYWGWHVSGLIAVGSVLSYLFPGDRVDWYAIFQAAIYVPLALAMPMLVPRRARRGAGAAAVVAICSLAFSFGGQVLTCIGYPHFEIFASAGIALMLTGLATGRLRVGIIGLVMAIMTREDGGLHAATFLAAVLAADLTKRPFPVPRRAVFWMAVAGGLSTIAMSFMQKRTMVTVDAWHLYLVGDPPYAHLTKQLLSYRLGQLASTGGFVWVPVLATVAIAVWRRDARYLLGWAVSLPWLLFNFTAFQELKGELSVYTGFPFVGCAAWPAAYARSAGPSRAWRWPVVAGALVSLASLVGLLHGFRVATTLAFRDMFVDSAVNERGVKAFAGVLRRRELGPVLMSPAAFSWGLEGVRNDELADYRMTAGAEATANGYAFFLREDPFGLLATSGFTRCGRVAETTFYYCTRPQQTLPDTVVVSDPLVRVLQVVEPLARREGEEIFVSRAPGLELGAFGPFARLSPGRYTVRWHVRYGACVGPGPVLKVDAVRHPEILGVILAASQGEPLEVTFEVPAEKKDAMLEFRVYSGSCDYWLRSVELGPARP